ncbi:MAG: TraR/DksA C4-type zinc finger protein [bacterium]
MEKQLLNDFKNKLLAEKEDIENKLKNIATEDTAVKGNYKANYHPIGRSEEENADEVTFYEQNISEEHHLEEDLVMVRDALERIEKETYGKCLKCGKEIPTERLAAYPSAKYCMQCKDAE